jgi:hypothetical protein
VRRKKYVMGERIRGKDHVRLILQAMPLTWTNDECEISEIAAFLSMESDKAQIFNGCLGITALAIR